eukprot:6192322-Pleurochrysis_carterae.AAC.5
MNATGDGKTATLPADAAELRDTAKPAAVRARPELERREVDEMMCCAVGRSLQPVSVVLMAAHK